MKVRVKNNKLDNFDEEYRVTNINYDMVVAEADDKKLYFHQEDVEIIPENDYEDALTKCKDLIKIKLCRGISLRFYSALLDTLVKTINVKVEAINLLKDEYKLIKKGLWEKLMLMIVNEKYALLVSVIGRNYGRNFDITIKDYNLRSFVDECCFEMDCLNKEIKEKEQTIERYKKGLKDVIGNSNSNGQTMLLVEPQQKEIKGAEG